MKTMIMMTIVYILGLLVFLLTDICEMNYLYYIAVGIGIVGSLLVVKIRRYKL